MLACAFPAIGAAGIWRWTDAQGRVHFSDVPARGATEQRGGHVGVVRNPAHNLAALRHAIPFREQGGAMQVDGFVNGVAMPFIVDTGASIVVVPEAMARRAGLALSDVPTVTLRTANGEVHAPMTRLGRLRLGDLELRDVRAAVWDVSGDGRTGLLGMNVLGRFVMKVDHGRRTLLLERR